MKRIEVYRIEKKGPAPRYWDESGCKLLYDDKKARYYYRVAGLPFSLKEALKTFGERELLDQFCPSISGQSWMVAGKGAKRFRRVGHLHGYDMAYVAETWPGWALAKAYYYLVEHKWCVELAMLTVVWRINAQERFIETHRDEYSALTAIVTNPIGYWKYENRMLKIGWVTGLFLKIIAFWALINVFPRFTAKYLLTYFRGKE